MTTHFDRVGAAQVVLDLWRSALAPTVRRWSLVVSAPDLLEVTHDEMAVYDGGGALAPFLAVQAVDRGIDPQAVVGPLADAVRPVPGEVPLTSATDALLALVGGPRAVNERLRRTAYRTRVRPTGATVLPAEHAEMLAALAGNPAYDAVRTALAADAPWGLAAWVSSETVLWHVQAWTATTRHGGAVLALPDGAELAVHCFTEVEPAPLTLADPTYAAMGRAFALTLRELGLGGLVSAPGL
ncbi:hypothetical protein RDV89_15225 [Nocardioides zeae]|uniref:GNAT family N-acetyltransferase n=1 Tax=Nocardioides imazamoxiresistens TaxID=3231893 RepID=A0ABU3PZ57_9ACTN|nr:hypothetical protein [Nocardioides zeae]MDT9594434.1 hypothetical protein [Nocardioides zeae]